MPAGQVVADATILGGLGITTLAVAASGAPQIVAAGSPVPADLTPLLGVLFVAVALTATLLAVALTAR